MKLMTKTIEKEFAKYPLYSQDGKGLDAVVVVKYFNPCGSGTWYITEGNKEENGDWMFFGYVTGLGEDELGYVMLSQLEEIKVPPYKLPLERDLYIKKGSTIKDLLD